MSPARWSRRSAAAASPVRRGDRRARCARIEVLAGPRLRSRRRPAPPRCSAGLLGPPRRSPRAKRSTSLTATAAQRSAAANRRAQVLADQGEAVDVAGAALVAPLGRRRLAGPPWRSVAVIAELEDRTAAEDLRQAA
jgi:hypothetical protein